MKKLLTLTLALLMLLSVTACSEKKAADNKDDSKATEEVTAEIKEDYATETQEKVHNTPTPIKPIEAKLTRGKVEGKKYTSDYTGLKFNMPEGWEYSSDAEMASLLNMGTEMISEENIAETLTNTTMVYDMKATDKTTGDYVAVYYENMNMICGKTVDAAEYVETLKERVGAQMQLDHEFKDEGIVLLSGEEYHRVVACMKTDVFEMNQAYYIRIIDDVIIRVETTLIGDTTVADVEAMFEQ